jgi:branched-chain amino acid transport system substrate-binding protein
MSRRVSLAHSVAAFAFFMLAFVLGCRPAEAVRIGFLADLISELGVGGRNGAELAVETLNARGGARYELVVADDRNDAGTARSAVASFASRGAAFVVGPMTSAMAVAVVPEANQRGIVLISPTATTDELSGKDDFFFRTAADAPAGARQLADLLHDRGARSVVVLMDTANGAYSSSFGRAAAAEFVKLGGVATELGYRSGNSLDFAGAMRRADGRSPDAVILVDSPSDAAIATEHLRRVAPGVVIALSPWGANMQFVQIGGRASEGAIAMQAIDLDSPLPRMRDFIARYRARFGDLPTTPAVQGYEAVMLGVDAMSRRGGASLRATLAAAGRWDGLDGPFSLDAYGDAHRELHLTVVRNGRFEALRPRPSGAVRSGPSAVPFASLLPGTLSNMPPLGDLYAPWRETRRATTTNPRVS